MATELEKNIEETENKSSTETKKDDQKTSVSELEARIKQLESENGKLRQANTNASADASAWKKKYNERLSEEDRKKEEQEEQSAALQKELESLRAERNVANHKAKLLSLGFDDELAQEVAVSINAGETDGVFDGLRKFIATHDKQLRENAFRSNQTLQGGDAGKAVTKEQFDKMGYKERVKVYEQYPDLYKEYTK